MFLVVKGRFRMEFREREEWIEEGEFHRRAPRHGTPSCGGRRVLDYCCLNRLPR